MMWTGPWRRPHSYGDPAAEVRAVHESLGVIDVSTLGKILVEGPGAAELLDRLYPNRFTDLKPGRIRYGVLTTDGGRIIDDGTVARLGDDLFYVTTTSTGSSGVCEWFEWWNAVWGYDAEIVNLTGALAAVNVAGPRAREALASLTDDDVSNEALRYLDARELRVAGVPCLALRIGFVGELGYELHCAAGVAEHVWDALVAGGRGAVRARAAARPPPREGARDRRPGHRLRVEPALGRDAVDRQARQGRLRRQVGPPPRAGPRAARRLHRGRRSRPRARRSCATAASRAA